MFVNDALAVRTLVSSVSRSVEFAAAALDQNPLLTRTHYLLSMSPLARYVGQMLFAVLSAIGLLMGSAAAAAHASAPAEAMIVVDLPALDTQQDLGPAAVHHALDHAQAVGSFPGAMQQLPIAIAAPWEWPEAAATVPSAGGRQERPPMAERS